MLSAELQGDVLLDLTQRAPSEAKAVKGHGIQWEERPPRARRMRMEREDGDRWG